MQTTHIVYLLCTLCGASALQLTALNFTASSPLNVCQSAAVSAFYSLVLPDMVYTGVRGILQSIVALVAAPNEPFLLGIWRKNIYGNFTYIRTVTNKSFTATGFQNQTSSDFGNFVVYYGDYFVLSLAQAQKNPVCRQSSNTSIQYTTLGRNLFAGPLPIINDTFVPASTNSATVFAIAVNIIEDDVTTFTTTMVYQKGLPGIPGSTGVTGANGAVGITGPPGMTGAPGSTGPTGDKGDVGRAGPQGRQLVGEKGGAGPVGPTGLLGLTGQPGPAGYVTDAGVVGITGPTGAVGADGRKGVPGPKGLTGPQGPKGSNGPTGPVGATGVAGAVGAQGQSGSKGSQGKPGLNIPGDVKASCPAANPCNANSVCQDTIYGPACICKNGFEPVNKTYCTDIDECAKDGIMKCQQACNNTVGSYMCSCRYGYVLAPDLHHCTAIDTCSLGSAQCKSSEKCHSAGGYTQCIPASIMLSTAAMAGSSAASSVPLQQTAWMSEAWVIIFIVWSGMLSIILVVLIGWMAHEMQQTRLSAELELLYAARLQDESMTISSIESRHALRFHDRTFAASQATYDFKVDDIYD